MTSYIITCNSYIMSYTAHLHDSNLLSFLIQCVTQKLTIPVGPNHFCTICSYQSTDYSYTITCMSQHCKMGNMLCTSNIHTATKKETCTHEHEFCIKNYINVI